jgi:hypothetical protein
MPPIFTTAAPADALIYLLIIFLLYNAAKLLYGYLFHRSNFSKIPGPPSQSWITGEHCFTPR